MEQKTYQSSSSCYRAFPDWPHRHHKSGVRIIGTLPGEGVGPEIMAVAISVIDLINQSADSRFVIEQGGQIGLPALRDSGNALTEEVAGFCESVFARHGAVLCGPGGGRFVYELRNRFDLYCKLTPIVPFDALAETGVVKPEAKHGVDLIVVRENTGGLYFGNWGSEGDHEDQTAFHRFEYTSFQVERILSVALQLAKQRRNKLTLVVKPGGIPSISELWTRKARKRIAAENIDFEFLEVDNAAYQMIANARAFDVVVAPNMFGDVLSDNGALLLGSRGLSYSGNFGAKGAAVYQTGHGAAHDLAGTDTANPIGQILALAMMLSESFGLVKFADAIIEATTTVLGKGIRTRDIAVPGCAQVGTREMGERIRRELERQLRGPTKEKKK